MPYRKAIMRRIKRFDSREGRLRPGDWNVVNSSVGAAWEPVYADALFIDQFPASYDLDDDITRVDDHHYDWDWRDGHHKDPKTNMPLIGGMMNSLGAKLSFATELV